MADTSLDLLQAMAQRVLDGQALSDKRMAAIERALFEIRSEMDGQFELMMARGAKADGLEKIVAALGRRVSAPERK